MQAYSKRAKPVLEWLAQLAGQTGRRIPVRLVKGAYWDTEIKRAQEQGFAGYPLFTRKVSTDVSYLACARYLLGASRSSSIRSSPPTMPIRWRPSRSWRAMTAASSSSACTAWGRRSTNRWSARSKMNQPCRIYAPVGSHEDLLAYLVRRLLENGANTSFVNRLADDEAPIAEIIADPVVEVGKLTDAAASAHPAAAPTSFRARCNSSGHALWDDATRERFVRGIDEVTSGSDCRFRNRRWQCSQVRPRPHHHLAAGPPRQAGRGAGSRRCGRGQGHGRCSLGAAWLGPEGRRGARGDSRDAPPISTRRTARLMALLVREAGKTLDNAMADLREAVDFLRYYAQQAPGRVCTVQCCCPAPPASATRCRCTGAASLPASRRGTFRWRSSRDRSRPHWLPATAWWPSPPSRRRWSPIEAVRLLHQAGVPPEVLQFLPGDGARIGKVMLSACRALAGVAFTGSNDTAALINRALAARDGAIPTLIAETGGMNAMIVDSSALPEQAVRDVLASAFDSAGQRCSAARLLFVQDDVAPARHRRCSRAPWQSCALAIRSTMPPTSGRSSTTKQRQALDAHKARMAREGQAPSLDLPLPAETRAWHLRLAGCLRAFVASAG